MSKRKICIFCETWESGGIESFLTNILLRLDMQIFSVDVVVAALKDSVFTRELQQRGVSFRQLSGSPRKMVQNLKAFRQILKDQDYDVLHLNIYQALSMSYALEAQKAGIPVRIIHSHNTALRKSLTRPVKLAVHTISKKFFSDSGTCFLACSTEAARFMFSKEIVNKMRYSVVPNGIKTERFLFCKKKREQFREQQKIQDKFVVGNIGRLCYQKNQSFLLDVFSSLHAMRPDSKLLLVGAGDDERMLREKAERLHIEDDVLFYGTTSAPEVTLWAMDVFVFPSLFEGLGIVAIEAQASGLPVVCSDAIPKEAFVTKQMKKLPLSSGAIEWANTISNCSALKDRGESAKRIRQAGFDIEDVAKQMVAYYTEG